MAKWDPVEVAAGHTEVAGSVAPSRQQDGIKER